MTPFKNKIVLQEGQTLVKSFRLLDSFKNPINLTGVTARMEIRPSVSDNDGPALLELTTENGGINISPELGLISLYHPRIELAHSGQYDIFLITEEGDAIPFILPSAFTVKEAVTNV